MLCLLALATFASLALFSASYRPLAREALGCVFRRVTLRTCTTGFDRRVRAAVVGRAMRHHPAVARVLHRHLEVFAWAFVLLLAGSSIALGRGLYNFHRYGSCYGPVQRGFCVFDPSGRHARYSGVVVPQGGPPVVPDDGGAEALGPSDAPVTVIEFGCYGCPFTRESVALVDTVLARHAAGVRFVYRPFPLDAVDPTAPPTCDAAGPPGAHAGATGAAIAAACARAQGRFWEYHRRLLSQPEAIATCDGLVQLARDLGMEADRFARCLGDPAAHAEIRRHVDDGVRAGIYGTPTFYVNGARLVAPSPEALEDAIRDARSEGQR